MYVNMNITLYHVIYSVQYYPRFHVTALGLGMYYSWIQQSACIVNRTENESVSTVYKNKKNQCYYFVCYSPQVYLAWKPC